FEKTPVALKLVDVVDVAFGGGVGCAVAKDGSVSCWGMNANGGLGFASDECGPYYSPQGDGPPARIPARCEPSPHTVPGLQGIAGVAVGGRHRCALDAGRRLWCWGDNVWGQLGSGQPAPLGTSRAPALIPDFTATQV